MARQRFCSHCNQSGHNRRTCLILSQKVEEVELKSLQNDSEGRSIFVDSYSATHHSPFVLRLPERRTDDIWRSVPVFSETTPAEPVRAQVDFADLIKQSTQSSSLSSIKVNLKLPVDQVGQPDNTLPTTEILRPLVMPERFTPKPVRASVFVSAWRTFTESLNAFPSYFRLAPARVFVPVIAVIMLLVLPFPVFSYWERVRQNGAELAAVSTRGFLSLQASTAAALSSDLDGAAGELTNALEAFAAAKQISETSLSFVFKVGSFLPVFGGEIESRERLLEAGSHLALGNTYLLKGLKEVSATPEMPFTDKLKIIRTHMKGAIPQYEAAAETLERVDDGVVPLSFQNDFIAFRDLYFTFVSDLHDLMRLSDGLLNALGESGLRRYLLVFQNSDELRPTGGFIGSFALLDLQKGKIEKIDVPAGGSYDLQGQFYKNITLPEPLQIINKRLEFQDANWSPDFAVSARTLIDIYQTARPETVDGVIAINSSLLPRLVRVLGTVPLETLSGTLNLSAEQIIPSLQAEVESEAARKTGRPKESVGKLLNEMMSVVPSLSRADFFTLLVELNEAAEQRDVQVYFEDEKVQKIFSSFGWTGEFESDRPLEDYLFVVNSNLRGEKSDAKIRQSIEHEAVVGEDGVVEVKVKIKRTHDGQLGEEFYGAFNNSFVRFYVPRGAKLISSSGFNRLPDSVFRAPLPDSEPSVFPSLDRRTEATDGEILYSGEEGGRAVFGSWLITAPGHTSSAELVYRLPFRLISSNGRGQTLKNGISQSVYSFLTQKQSGARTVFSSRVLYPQSWTPVWRSDNRVDLTLSGAMFSVSEQKNDERFTVLFESDKTR